MANFVSLMSGMAARSKGLPIVWQFFKDNYEMLTRKLSSNQLSNVFGNICQYFGDITKRIDVNKKSVNYLIVLISVFPHKRWSRS